MAAWLLFFPLCNHLPAASLVPAFMQEDIRRTFFRLGHWDVLMVGSRSNQGSCSLMENCAPRISLAFCKNKASSKTAPESFLRIQKQLENGVLIASTLLPFFSEWAANWFLSNPSHLCFLLSIIWNQGNALMPLNSCLYIYKLMLYIILKSHQSCSLSSFYGLMPVL